MTGKGFKSSIRKGITDDIRRTARTALRRAAVEVLKELKEISPNWSGEFRESWVVRSSDGTEAVKEGEGDYGYNLFNVPRIEDVRKPVTLTIDNISPYAEEAMDLKPSVFIYPGFEPKGEVVREGIRINDIRGDIDIPEDGRSRNRSTAPLDWYTTYMEGGGFQRDFKKGAELGFARKGATRPPEFR